MESKIVHFFYVSKVSSNYIIMMALSSKWLSPYGGREAPSTSRYTFFWFPIPVKRKGPPNIHSNRWKYYGPLGSHALPDNSLGPGILSHLMGQPKSVPSLPTLTPIMRKVKPHDSPFPKAKDAEQTKKKSNKSTAHSFQRHLSARDLLSDRPAPFTSLSKVPNSCEAHLFFIRIKLVELLQCWRSSM